MAIRKIELMHRFFGAVPGRKCKECKHFKHFRYNNRMLSKCKVYGLTNSNASDWSGRHQACGMFNKPWKCRNIIEYVKPERCKPKNTAEEIDGQERFW